MNTIHQLLFKSTCKCFVVFEICYQHCKVLYSYTSPQPDISNPSIRPNTYRTKLLHPSEMAFISILVVMLNDCTMSLLPLIFGLRLKVFHFLIKGWC